MHDALGYRIDARLDVIQFLHQADQRHHDFGHHQSAGLVACLDRRLEDGARLHLGDLRIGDRESAAAMAEHRVELMQRLGALPELVCRYVHCGSDLGEFGLGLGQEFMQRRVEQADRHRQAGHDLEQLEEIRALHRQELVERCAPILLGVGQDHLAVAVEEHVLRAAKADAFCAEGARHARIERRFGIGAHLHAARGIRPFHDGGEVAGEFRLQHGDRALQHLAIAAVDGDDVALAEGLAHRDQRAGLVVDAQRTGARHAGLAHAARHDRRMAGHAAARGEDAFGGMHAVDVLGAGLDAHQDRLAPLRLGVLGIAG